jgi:anti-anti-sigma factor
MDLQLTELPNQVSRIALRGRLDSTGVDGIESKFTACSVAAGRNAVIDLTGVTFLASMGIRMFISCANAQHRRGTKMVLFGADGPVREVLETVALDQLIPIADSEQQALALLA